MEPRPYLFIEPSRAKVERTPGVVLLEFGADWCGFSQAAQLSIGETLARYSSVQHIKVADGPGQPLGRSYGVRLWPTLIVLKDGKELDRLVRPEDRRALSALLAAAVETVTRSHTG
jgi:thioredoxin 1